MKLSLTNEGKINLNKISPASPAPCWRLSRSILTAFLCNRNSQLPLLYCWENRGAGKTEALGKQRRREVIFPGSHLQGEREPETTNCLLFPPYTSSLHGVCLLNGKASTMCEISDHLFHPCFTDRNTLKPREQLDVFEVTWVAGDRARVRTGGTSSRTESTDVLGEAGGHCYGNLKKRW